MVKPGVTNFEFYHFEFQICSITGWDFAVTDNRKSRQPSDFFPNGNQNLGLG